MNSKYNLLRRAELSTEYLHTNSTTHEFLFGALAELVDNSRDARARNLNIYTETPKVNLRGGFMLCLLDDGEGMTPEEAYDVIKFGHSNKKNIDLDLIGQYGNGLKSGSMRLGNDLMIFTKKNGTMTSLLLSRDFLLGESIKNVLICLPSFKESTREPIYVKSSEGRDEIDLFNLEMNLILKYSPFRTKEEFMSQFDRIQGSSGTLVIIYSLKLNEDGNPELDIHTDPTDIRMSQYDQENEKLSKPEQKSFRAYCSILYYNPKMKIYIQNKKVKTKILEKTLLKPLRYMFTSKKFRSRSNAEKAEAEKRLRQAEATRKEAVSRFEHFMKSFNPKSREENNEYSRLLKQREDAYALVETEKLNLERKSRAVNESKGLEFIFGINVFNRDADGLYIYNSNRLILMSEQARMQKKNNSEYRGIIGIVNVPYLVLEPTHNKQSFADRHEQQQLIAAMSDHMEQYLIHCGYDLDKEFWKRFGYVDNSRDPPLDDYRYLRVRYAQTKLVVQCNDCLKWRQLIFHERYLVPEIVADDWVCAQNTDPNKNSCRFVESLPEIELREFDHNRKQAQKDKEKEKEQQRQIKRQQILQTTNDDYTYEEEDDEPPRNRRQQATFIDPSKTANSFYSSLSSSSQKIVDKSIDKAKTNTTATTSILRSSNINNSTANNEQPETNKRRIRFTDGDSSENDDEEESKKKKKISRDETDDRRADPTFRPGASLSSIKNTSRKSTATKSSMVAKNSASRQPMVVNEDADEDNDDGDTTLEENVSTSEYRKVLNNFNKESKANFVKPEPVEVARDRTRDVPTTSADARFSLDSRTVQVLNGDERSLSKDPLVLAKEKEIYLTEITLSQCKVLKHLATKVSDQDSKTKIDNFEDVADLLDFNVDEFLEKFDRRQDLIQARRLNKKLDKLKQKILEKFDLDADEVSELFDEVGPKIKKLNN